MAAVKRRRQSSMVRSTKRAARSGAAAWRAGTAVAVRRWGQVVQSCVAQNTDAALRKSLLALEQGVTCTPTRAGDGARNVLAALWAVCGGVAAQAPSLPRQALVILAASTTPVLRQGRACCESDGGAERRRRQAAAACKVRDTATRARMKRQETAMGLRQAVVDATVELLQCVPQAVGCFNTLLVGCSACGVVAHDRCAAHPGCGGAASWMIPAVPSCGSGPSSGREACAGCSRPACAQPATTHCFGHCLLAIACRIPAVRPAALVWLLRAGSPRCRRRLVSFAGARLQLATCDEPPATPNAAALFPSAACAAGTWLRAHAVVACDLVACRSFATGIVGCVSQRSPQSHLVAAASLACGATSAAVEQLVAAALARVARLALQVRACTIIACVTCTAHRRTCAGVAQLAFGLLARSRVVTAAHAAACICRAAEWARNALPSSPRGDTDGTCACSAKAVCIPHAVLLALAVCVTVLPAHHDAQWCAALRQRAAYPAAIATVFAGVVEHVRACAAQGRACGVHVQLLRAMMQRHSSPMAALPASSVRRVAARAPVLWSAKTWAAPFDDALGSLPEEESLACETLWCAPHCTRCRAAVQPAAAASVAFAESGSSGTDDSDSDSDSDSDGDGDSDSDIDSDSDCPLSGLRRGVNKSEWLSMDSLQLVLSYLPPPALVRCRGVNRDWRIAASSNALWKRVFERRWGARVRCLHEGKHKHEYWSMTARRHAAEAFAKDLNLRRQFSDGGRRRVHVCAACGCAAVLDGGDAVRRHERACGHTKDGKRIRSTARSKRRRRRHGRGDGAPRARAAKRARRRHHV